MLQGGYMEDELAPSIWVLKQCEQLKSELSDLLLRCNETVRESKLIQAWLNAIAMRSQAAEINARRAFPITPELIAVLSPNTAIPAKRNH